MISNKNSLIIIFSIFFFQCKKEKKESIENIKAVEVKKLINLDTVTFTDGYDFPVGKPDAKHYYNAKGFKRITI